MLWDMYQVRESKLCKPIKRIKIISQLREGVKELAEGGEEGAQEIRLKLTTIHPFLIDHLSFFY